jgi:hypothetical protein
MTDAERTPSAVSHPRLKLALMFLLPLMAVGLATLVYVTGIGIPKTTTNKGVLLPPPRQIDELPLQSAAGAPWRYATDGASWGILVAGGAECEGLCRERLLLARQVHRTLGREQHRVKRYYLDTADTVAPATAAWLASEQEGLTVLRAPEEAMRGLLANRPSDPDPLTAIYLVDKRGFVMMYYLPTHPGRAMTDDLRFLLRNSPE